MKQKDEKKAEVLNYITQGNSQEESFRKAGIGKTTFYKWLEEREFRDAVHNAQEEARISKADVRGVERALLDIAKGFEYEEVKTEYESKVVEDENGKKEYKPVIKKQVRTVKRIPPNVEAIKFLLTNRDPENWKNRIDTMQMGRVSTDLHIVYNGTEADKEFPHSESELDLEKPERPTGE